MAAKAIDNSNLINHRGTQPAGFTPNVSWTYDAQANEVVFSDGTTIPSGDDLQIIHCSANDKFGGEVRGSITDSEDNVTLDVSSLNKSKGLDIRATVLTARNIAADGGAYNIGAAGDLSNWDVQQNA